MVSQKLCIASLLIASSLVLANLTADQPRPAERSFVLLKNGNVLKGSVRAEKDRISIADGSSNVFVETKQIAFVGPTLESLYQHQRSNVKQWGTGEHWQLAYWCIQQGLIDRAVEHYEVLEKNASDSPRFKQLEHLLRQALMADESVKQAVHLQAEPNPVSRANTETPQSKTEDTAPDKEQIADSWTKHEIPGYIRKTFHSRILPILVSRCGQSGCHGMMGKSEFHLYQPVGDQSAVILARDLDEVLKYINREHIQDSPLMAYATKAHGIQRNPSLNQAKAEERQLIEHINFWVKSLALSQKPASNMPNQYPSVPPVDSGVTAASANLHASTPPVRNSKRLNDVEQDRNAKLSKPAKSATPTEFLSMSEISDLEAAIEKFEKQSGSGTTQAKKDPFDPDVFNRKYR
ncbi:MAG: hypothetical protein NTY15_08670 [Planctomycetota bacterium]|nr:hypothetical protein [Planctomycetota bacterium]